MLPYSAYARLLGEAKVFHSSPLPLAQAPKEVEQIFHLIEISFLPNLNIYTDRPLLNKHVCVWDR